jgi:hypothetical protein
MSKPTSDLAYKVDVSPPRAGQALSLDSEPRRNWRDGLRRSPTPEPFAVGDQQNAACLETADKPRDRRRADAFSARGSG